MSQNSGHPACCICHSNPESGFCECDCAVRLANHKADAAIVDGGVKTPAGEVTPKKRDLGDVLLHPLIAVPLALAVIAAMVGGGIYFDQRDEVENAAIESFELAMFDYSKGDVKIYEPFIEFKLFNREATEHNNGKLQIPVGRIKVAVRTDGRDCTTLNAFKSGWNSSWTYWDEGTILVPNEEDFVKWNQYLLKMASERKVNSPKRLAPPEISPAD